MAWTVEFHEDFLKEFLKYSATVQDELLAKALLLEKLGPGLGRPHVDTLRGSKYAGMKEMRFDADHGIWRVAFAFDPDRNAIVLMGGNKKGKDERRFYQKLIRIAEDRFERHLKIIGKD